MTLADAPPTDSARSLLAGTVWPRVFSAHLLGGLAVFLFLLQVITGTLLLIYYRPAAGAAYHSVAIVTDEVRLGWLIRGVHAWGSDLLIAVTFVHLIRVYFLRAYLGPRRWVWATGILLCFAILAFGFTGGLLPWDQYAYWSVDAARQTIFGIPFLGTMLLNLFWGGWELGEEVLLRFYAFHVGIIPFLALLLLCVHAALLWWYGFQESADGRPAHTLSVPPSWVEFALDVTAVIILTYAVVVSLAIVFPPTLWDPADPVAPIPYIQPRWYLLPARVMLRGLVGGAAAVVVMGLLVLFLLVPWIDREPHPPRWARVAQAVGGVAFLAVWVILAVLQYRS